MLKAQYKFDGLMNASTQLGPSDFESKRLKKSGTLVVLFAAEWCPFCRRFSSIFDSVLAEKGLAGGLADLSDLENPLWEEFGIDVVPTVMVFKEGELIYRKDGVLGRGLPDNAMNEVLLKLRAGNKAVS
jgi:thioredoxin 1